MKERLVFIGNTIKDPNPFIETAKFEPATHLSKKTPKERLESIMTEVTRIVMERTVKEDYGGEPTHAWIIEDNPQEILQAARDLMVNTDFIEVLFSTMTLVKLEAETHSDRVEEETGMRVVHFTKSETSFPTHPTPAH